MVGNRITRCLVCGMVISLATATRESHDFNRGRCQKAQTALCCSKRYVACCVRSVDVTNELLSSLILSKANYPVRLNVEISIGKNHRDIQLQETNNIDIIHMTKSDYACVSV